MRAFPWFLIFAAELAYANYIPPSPVSDVAYDATTWNGVANACPSKNATRDQLETMLASIAGKEPAITSGTTAQYWRGDKSFQDFATAAQAAVDTETLTWSNKSFLTDTNRFVDPSDPTKKVAFDASLLDTGKTGTVKFAAFPGGHPTAILVEGTMMTESGTNTVSNKTFQSDTNKWRTDTAGNVQDLFMTGLGSGDGDLTVAYDPVGSDILLYPACDSCTVAYTETIFYQTVRDEGTARTQRPSINFIGAGVSCVDNGGSTRTDCTIDGGAVRTHITLATSVLHNVLAAGGAPADNCTLALTNLNTTKRQVGTQVNVKMDGFSNARGIFRLKNAGGQSGQISCRIQNLTDTTTLIASTNVTTGTACVTAEGTATGVALTGVKQFACECSNAAAADDPLLGYCGLELSP